MVNMLLPYMIFPILSALGRHLLRDHADPARDLYRDHPGEPRRADAPVAREKEGL